MLIKCIRYVFLFYAIYIPDNSGVAHMQFPQKPSASNILPKNKLFSGTSRLFTLEAITWFMFPIVCGMRHNSASLTSSLRCYAAFLSPRVYRVYQVELPVVNCSRSSTRYMTKYRATEDECGLCGQAQRMTLKQMTTVQVSEWWKWINQYNISTEFRRRMRKIFLVRAQSTVINKIKHYF